MICQICREAAAITDATGPDEPVQNLKDLHAGCKGTTHCDCQHRPTTVMRDGSRSQRR